MMIRLKNILPFVYCGVLAAVLGFAAAFRPANTVQPPELPPRQTLMNLSPDFREEFVQYATIDRVDDVSRNLYIERAALDAWTPGEPLPDRTRLVIEVRDIQRSLTGNPRRDAQGRFVQAHVAGNLHMAEKRDNWQLSELASSSRVGDWNFASFDRDTFASTNENVNDCFTCHDTASRRDFVFSYPILVEYVQSGGEVQYSYCNRPNRAACG